MPSTIDQIYEEITWEGRTKKLFDIKIAGLTYKVLEAQALEVCDTPCSGAVNSTIQEIFLSSGGRVDGTKQTLLHEIFHALSNEYAFGWDEAAVTAYSTVVFDVLNRNPKLRKYIFDE